MQGTCYVLVGPTNRIVHALQIWIWVGAQLQQQSLAGYHGRLSSSCGSGLSLCSCMGSPPSEVQWSQCASYKADVKTYVRSDGHELAKELPTILHALPAALSVAECRWTCQEREGARFPESATAHTHTLNGSRGEALARALFDPRAEGKG